MTELIANWPGGFGGFGVPTVDALGPGEGWGIFPRGQKVIAETNDILGGSRRRVRAEWTLKLHRGKDHRGGDPGVQPLLEQLALWVRSGAPVLGEAPPVRLENARLVYQAAEPLARYEATLIAEFEE